MMFAKAPPRCGGGRVWEAAAVCCRSASSFFPSFFPSRDIYIYIWSPPPHDPHLCFFLFSLSYEWSHQGMWELAKNTGIYSVFALFITFMTYMLYVIWV